MCQGKFKIFWPIMISMLEVALLVSLIFYSKTSTNEETHKLVMKYEHLLPDYDGLDGKGNGPRYCPSLYKKGMCF